MTGQTLGEKIKAVRIQRQMTQSEVAGDFITRNMLSQIENDSANPSIKTIEYLAKTLKKSISFFLDDTASQQSQNTTNGMCLNLDPVRDLLAAGDTEAIIRYIKKDSNITEYANKEEIINLLYTAYSMSAEAKLKEGSPKDSVYFLESAVSLLNQSSYHHTTEIAETVIRIYEISLTTGYPINPIIRKSAEDISKIEDLFKRIKINKAHVLYSSGELQESLSCIESLKNISSSSASIAHCAYLKAAILLDESTDITDPDEIIRLLQDAETSFSQEELALYLKNICKMKARVYSSKGDYKAAYQYLEMSEKPD